MPVSLYLYWEADGSVAQHIVQLRRNTVSRFSARRLVVFQHDQAESLFGSCLQGPMSLRVIASLVEA